MTAKEKIGQIIAANGVEVSESESSLARSNLDGLVVNLELTLISIIQGVALYFLTESSRGLLISMQFAAWPYIVSGLLIIMLWWSRAVIHTLTVIRWPIEFGHNFLYVASTLVEAVMFTQVGNPANWFMVATVNAALVWALFSVDLRLVTRRMAEQCGPANQALLQVLYKEQRFQAAVAWPLTTAACLAIALVIRLWSGFFLDQNGQLIFGVLQLIGVVSYLVYITRYFKRISGLVLAARAEGRQ
jgi:hypothetical protein